MLRFLTHSYKNLRGLNKLVSSRSAQIIYARDAFSFGWGCRWNLAFFQNSTIASEKDVMLSSAEFPFFDRQRYRPLYIMTGNRYSEKQKGCSHVDKALGRTLSLNWYDCVFKTKASYLSLKLLLTEAGYCGFKLLFRILRISSYCLKTSTQGKIENHILGNEENCTYLNQNKTIWMQSF